MQEINIIATIKVKGDECGHCTCLRYNRQGDYMFCILFDEQGPPLKGGKKVMKRVKKCLVGEGLYQHFARR